jgi:hypothetical protein
MKAFTRFAIASVLLVGSAGLTFAQATTGPVVYALNFRSIPDQNTIGTVDVPVTQAIRDWFQARSVDGFSKDKAKWNNGRGSTVYGSAIDGSKIDAPLASLSEGEKDAIDAVVNDSDLRGSLEALINPALKAALVRGQTEQATMRIGRHVWTMSLLGPEDN